MKEVSSLKRQFSPIDQMLVEAGRALEVLSGAVHASRPNPAGRPTAADKALSEAEQRHSAGLMRVNHVGEVCAQALYRGQALYCADPAIRDMLHHAAHEETDHLAWCADRLKELHSRPSYLNPLWYAGSFALGVVAGRATIARNLGFMAETETQVEKHLDSHLTRLPDSDVRSRKIVEQMRDDEISHRKTAERHGAAPLPVAVKGAMTVMAKIMTVAAYRV